MIGPFLTSLGCPKVLEKNGSQEPKKAPGIHPIYKCAKVRLIRPLLIPLGYPKGLGKNGSQGPKKEDFQK